MQKITVSRQAKYKFVMLRSTTSICMKCIKYYASRMKTILLHKFTTFPNPLHPGHKYNVVLLHYIQLTYLHHHHLSHLEPDVTNTGLSSSPSAVLRHTQVIVGTNQRLSENVEESQGKLMKSQLPFVLLEQEILVHIAVNRDK